MAIRRTKMKLHVANGHLAKLMGLLAHVVLSTCGIVFVYTLAIVDFGLKSTYDIILSRPFMRQLKMIQGWGSNHIYLKGKQGATRVEIVDHSYQGVAKIPLVDYDTHTSSNSKLSAWQQARAQFWMCGTLVCNSGSNDDGDSKTKDECCIPNHSHKIKLNLWNGLMSWQLWMFALIKQHKSNFVMKRDMTFKSQP